MTLPFRVTHPSRNVCVVHLDASDAKWEQYFLLSGDRHHDNPFTRQDLEKKHLDQAIERHAGIIDVGDLFCAMQGKYDKRASKSNLRPEHVDGNYLDRLVDTAADFYEPYARNWLVMAQGNHEKSIHQRHETCLLTRLAAILNDRTGSDIQVGGYTGWVRFQIQRNTERLSKRLWYAHGWGGGGPVTQDLIQDHRRRTYIDGADIIVTGHTHDAWAVENVKISLNNANVVEHRSVWSAKVGAYKQEYGDGEGGWHIERGGVPKPLGGWWLKIYRDGQDIRTNLIRTEQ